MRVVTAAGSRPLPLASIDSDGGERIATGIGELDRVLGGGLVKDSLVLIGGDPGIGKSTLLLQATRALAERAGPVLYVSGEESAGQVKLRAERLGVAPAVSTSWPRTTSRSSWAT
jgi:DNA repair protein RadA/Sms